MLSHDHIQQLERVISGFDPAGTNRYFLFGSSVRRDRFRDIDLAVVGNHSSAKPLCDLRESLYESHIPYSVDVVDFDQVDGPFRDYVLQNEPIVWDRPTKSTAARFAKAVGSLEKALQLEPLPEHAERDAALLRFELAAELMPKLLRRVLSAGGVDVGLPKDAVRAARAIDLADEVSASALIAAIDDRNRMVHDYNQDFSDGLFARVKEDHFPAFRALSHNVNQRIERT